MKFSESKRCVLVVLMGLILFGVHGRATPASPPSDNKVIIYPVATETIDQLTQQGITRVRDYGSYWLVQATDAQTAELTRLYGARAVKANDLNRIRLKSLSFDTTEGDPVVPAKLRQEEPTGQRLRLIQFCGPVRPQWLRQVQSAGNVDVVAYVPNNAYLIRLDQPAEDKLRAMEGPGSPIQWVGPYHPYYKIERDLLNRDAGNEKTLVDVRIMTVGSSEVERQLQEFGLIQQLYGLSHEKIHEMTIPLSAVSQIAKLTDVVWIEKIRPKHVHDENQVLIAASQTNGLPEHVPTLTSTIPDYLDFVTNTIGGGLASITNQYAYPIVDVCDTGFDQGGYGNIDIFSLDSVFYEFGRGPVVYGVSGASSGTGTIVVENGNALAPVVVSLGVDEPAPIRVAYTIPSGDYENPVTYSVSSEFLINNSGELGCGKLNKYWNGAEDFANRSIGHGTLVASMVIGYDTSPNSYYLPSSNGCVEVLSEPWVWTFQMPNPPPDVNTLVTSNNVCNFTYIGTPTESPVLPKPNTCTNVTVTYEGQSRVLVTNYYPTPVLIPSRVCQVHRDQPADCTADGTFQLGLGVSPFGRIGSTRVFAQAATFDSTAGFMYGPSDFCLTPLSPLPSAISDVLASVYGWGGRIENCSWSDLLDVLGDNGGVYSVESEAYDFGVRDALPQGTTNNVAVTFPLNQELITVFSSGGSGANGTAGGFGDIRTTPPATAKNVITVGASENARYDGSGCAVSQYDQNDSFAMFSLSAFGPTLDHRFKPEIVAPGGSVYGAIKSWMLTTNSSSDVVPGLALDICISPATGITNYYVNPQFYCDSAPSYAPPVVSGSIQLLWWYFQNRLTNELGQALYQPSPAMAKAYLCNSARYLPITDPSSGAMDTLPSDAQGMGELDLLRMFDGVPRAIRDESSPRAIDVALITTNPAPQQTYFSQSGQTYELSGQIASNGLPFRVTLAWTDAPGAVLAAQELVNNLGLEVILGGVTYYGNVFAQNVSVPGGTFDTINNMQSVFLNPTSWPNGIPAVTKGAPWKVIVRASNIAGNGVPNVGEPTPGGGSNTLNQDFALVVYNAATNTLSDIPNLATNNACQTAINISQFPYSFTNTLSASVYSKVFPSPSAGTGGSEEFFRIPLPTPGATFTVSTVGSSFANILSVWEVQVVPQTVYVRGECGALTELVSTNLSQVSFTADGTNDYFIVVEPAGGGSGGTMVLNVGASGVPITITPSSLSFGNQVAGTISAPQTATYLNGTPVSVNVQGVSITGSNAADFTIVSDGCPGSLLNPGGNCVVSVAFAPAITDIGLLQANLVFTDDQTASPRSIPMTGTATAPAPLVCLSTGTSINFSNQLIGTTSTAQSVTITNCGSIPLTVSNVTFSGTASNDFSVSQTCTNAPIAAGDTCTLQVTFTPSRSGTRQATLVISHSAAGSPATVSVHGVGVAAAPSICLSSSSIDFGSLVVTSTSTVQSLTITNCGTAPLAISNITLTAGNTGDFIIVSDPCTRGSISTGSACVVGLEFAPSDGGARSATLSITSSNNVPTPQLVTLSGTGALSQPDAAIGKTTKLKKMVGFNVITNVASAAEGIIQNVHRGAKKGVSFYVAVKNKGTGSDQFIVQGDGSGGGFTVSYFLGAKPSESVDVTAAVEAGTFMTDTMAAGAVTGDATMIRVVVTVPDKTLVLKNTTQTFTLTFTSASDPTKQDTVSAAVVAK
jgi:hypothetical protein